MTLNAVEMDIGIGCALLHSMSFIILLCIYTWSKMHAKISSSAFSSKQNDDSPRTKVGKKFGLNKIFIVLFQLLNLLSFSYNTRGPFYCAMHVVLSPSSHLFSDNNTKKTINIINTIRRIPEKHKTH